MMLTRRQFILTGIAAAGASVALQPWSRIWRTAIVGLGRSGIQYLAVGLLPEVKMTAICDIDPNATYSALNICREFSNRPQRQSDYRHILDDPDVDVLICATPVSSRRQIITEALAAGKHVYCVSPLAVSQEEGQDLINKAKTARRLLWQGTADPVWNMPLLAESLKSTLRDSTARLHLVRRVANPPIDRKAADCWFEGLDLFSRLSKALPLRARAYAAFTPEGRTSRLEFDLGESAPVGYAIVTTLPGTGSSEEWNIVVRSETISADVWVGIRESNGGSPTPIRDLASWREFSSCLSSGKHALWHDHYDRTLNSLAWLDRGTRAWRQIEMTQTI